MRNLSSVAGLPYALPDGEIVDVPGWNPRSEVLTTFRPEDMEPIPANPTHAEIVAGMHTLWRPWSAYRFAGINDKAAMLSAVITAVVRPGLWTSPGYFFDAPVQASGKTKAASALGALVRGRRGGVTPYVAGLGAEAELSKKIVSALIVGESFLLIDNVVGHWRSAVISSLLTDGVVNERLLGASTWYRGECRMMLTATGNNASLDLDLGRRFIKVRIDPGVEAPQALDYKFCPVRVALETRMEIARSVLVVIRAFHAAGAPRIGRGSAGFEDWEALVRRTVLWVDAEGLAEEAGLGAVGDPAASILEQAAADDPETASLRMLIAGLQTLFGTGTFQAKDVHAEVQRVWNGGGAEGADLVRDALTGLVHDSPKGVSTLTIGRVLANRRDRVVNGVALRALGIDRNGVMTWCVQ